ncbi:M28 family peptidase [Longimicrobium sp.]|uniref:M28 family peptidase n=1 Tax=Longimicrobium sp. TaxID=2029185 RepID=UPI002CAC2F9D|nr:M28 family peptidase [Longimicrobium sp.]HSU14890.1 M28 family peptidase [Longimicrobium sp.]
MLVRLVVPAALLASVSLLHAQQAMPGYSADAAARERRVEAAAIAATSPERASAHSRALSAETHVAGTPAQARTRDYVIGEMRRMGLETEVRHYRVWLPHATAVHLWRISPDARELALAEPPVPGDSTSVLAQYPTVNGTSAQGDVRGEVVYVNYGLVEDYARLDSLGVSVRGKIAVARYGRSFRGIKAREAERHGAVGLVIYSDPADDGFARGDVYPEGPMRPERGVQRGSILNSDGDPSTPGYPSTDNARRLSPAEMDIPRIPVIPVSYANAAELLRGVRGTAVPQAWQGGLPFRYHVGPGPVVARIAVETDERTSPMKDIWDTFGVIRGSELPDEIVMVGGHRDAWGPGAADNVSGTTSVLESARAVMEQVRAGNRPRRTIVFATWDAEEWGLVGSTEYVEEDSARLMRGAVAYLNQDVAAQGRAFDGGGSPSLRALLRDVAGLVPDPSGGGSVYQVWRKRTNLPDSAEVAMGNPGGGSDFAGFYNHLGIPIAEWGFGGPGGVYHSQYDSYAWMSRFGDPGFRYHAAAASVGAALLLRLANAEVLPYDYAEYARTMRGYLPDLEQALKAKGWDTAGTAPLRASVDAMEAAARDFATARDRALAGGALAPARRDAANRALLGVERALTRPEGLKDREWFRNLIYASDPDNGYSDMVFPGVANAARHGDRPLAESELADLARRFAAATAALREATRALGG